jgi:hypothetical protein
MAACGPAGTAVIKSSGVIMSQSDRNPLVGIWKLQLIQFEFADTGESVDVYGPNPSGYLILTEARMMAIVTRSDRMPPKEDADGAALFKTMMAYTGTYRVEGDDKFITDVDLAWHPAWNGTQQARFFKVDGDALSITTAQQNHPMFPGRTGRGVITWKRA